MSSEWLDDWKHWWDIYWLWLWNDLHWWIYYCIFYDVVERDNYFQQVLDDMDMIRSHVIELVEHGVTSVTFVWEEWANDFIANFEAWLLRLLGIEVEPDAPAIEHIANLWESIIALWARFGYAITNTDLTVVDWVNERITSVNDGIIAIWARFGPAFLEGDWTVVSWVEDKVTAVVQWVLSMYETARLQAQEATVWIADVGEAAVLWIATKGQVCADWLAEYGEAVAGWLNNYAENVAAWYDKYATFYADLYDNYHDLLLDFLSDPATFIGRYIDPIVVVPPGETEPGWLLELLKFLLNPFGWLLARVVGAWATIADWITEWLEENFPPLEVVLAAIPAPDLGLPTVEDWLRGLRDPETDEEKAYKALWYTKLQQILDDTIGDNPLTAAEFSSLFFNAPAGGPAP